MIRVLCLSSYLLGIARERGVKTCHTSLLLLTWPPLVCEVRRNSTACSEHKRPRGPQEKEGPHNRSTLERCRCAETQFFYFFFVREAAPPHINRPRSPCGIQTRKTFHSGRRKEAFQPLLGEGLPFAAQSGVTPQQQPFWFASYLAAFESA